MIWFIVVFAAMMITVPFMASVINAAATVGRCRKAEQTLQLCLPQSWLYTSKTADGDKTKIMIDEAMVCEMLQKTFSEQISFYGLPGISFNRFEFDSGTYQDLQTGALETAPRVTGVVNIADHAGNWREVRRSFILAYDDY